VFLGKLGLRNPAFAEEGKNFIGVRVGNASGSWVQGLRRRPAIIMLVFWQCLIVVGLAQRENETSGHTPAL
jgi:hypothetical protein